MRRWLCVPMMALCLLSGCGDGAEEESNLQMPYQNMSGCTMRAELSCEQEGLLWEGELECDYCPEGESRIRVLAPETIAGVTAVVDGGTRRLEYEDLCLDIGDLSPEEISPMEALPQLMDALREGWLLEENEEEWEDIPCWRVELDQTGPQGGKILSTLWLKTEDGTPLRGEIAVEGERIFTAEFTEFAFCDTMSTQAEN